MLGFVGDVKACLRGCYLESLECFAGGEGTGVGQSSEGGVGPRTRWSTYLRIDRTVESDSSTVARHVEKEVSKLSIRLAKTF